ncbi:MAG: helix-turn-helix domain-containing protein [bacterium]|nr:helix-turn-helix domain-containing protein [bacterium]
MREVKFPEVGTNLRAVRDKLRMTLDDVYQATNISRSYVSEFERGYRLPTVRYLKYLHDKHNVRVDYIFGGEEQMFRAEPAMAPLDFGKYTEDVDQLLEYMHALPPVMHAILGYFGEYRIENEKIAGRFTERKKSSQ